MGITAKSSRAKTTTTTATSSSSATDNNRGMGFLLVFFPDDKNSSSPGAGSPVSDAKQIAHRYDNYSLSSSPSPADSPGNAKPAMKRTNSSNPILTKTQSTISVCAFLVLFSFLLFALSTFEPPIPPHPVAAVSVHRRFLSERPINHHRGVAGGGGFYYWLDAAAGGIVGRRKREEAGDEYSSASSSPHSFALQGMGRLYRRGTRSMADLLVGHVAEDTTEAEFRLFLRLFHRSGLASRADAVFLFPSSSASRSGFEAVIREENDSFSALLRQHSAKNHSESKNNAASMEVEKEKWSWSRFDAGRFVKRANHSKGGMAAAAAGPMETTLLWGKKIRLNATINGSSSPTTTSSSSPTASRDGDSPPRTRVSYGSVVGFEASELDPENSLSGFLPNPQISLRRWACYPMLLGRVKRNFKHIMLADVKSTLILGPDPLARVRSRAPESLIYFSTNKETGKRGGGKKSARSGQAANPAVLMGGGRGIRRFSAAMLTEIVRAAMQHNGKRKTGVTESGILTHLLMGSSGEHILKNIKLMPSPDTIPGAGEAEEEWGRRYPVIQRGGNYYSGGISSNNNDHDDDLNSVIMKRICSCDDQDLLSPPVYKDCHSSSRELL
ncbi:unnamed protein product [Linum tenue]|uniref:DUF7780 domain-containing protein n=1 Tax=Linum tenue TaxID=586396 RepID=A0AAV0GRD3_9ROSI|nr:unnamed protein product [Linum tenue]